MHQKTRDAVEGSWVYRRAPYAMRPWLKLARMDRPVGTWLLLWPGIWSISLGGGRWPDLWLILIFAVGALVMRGAGCTYNDIVDLDFDARVARTASRPLPAGEISIFGAWVFLGLQCLIGFGALMVLVVFYGIISLYLGLFALALVAAYPFMKRITYWPQAWLGLTFNWGALMGYGAAHGSLNVIPFVLYGGAVFWTLGYDTIYAHQDKEDDALIGVKSTALALGENSKPWIASFYGVFLVALIGVGMLAKLTLIYYTGVAVAAGHLGYQVYRLILDDPDVCLSVFRSNIQFGWIIALALILDRGL